jgi:hypothetical protein
MHYLVLIVIALIGATIKVLKKRGEKKASYILRIYLLWLIAWGIGAVSILGFVAHAFAADHTAMYIGWLPGSPFQFEIAVANLAMGVLGLMCIWLEDQFWLATIVSMTVFSWGAAYGHIRDIMINHNYAPGNAGAPLYMDLIAPAVFIILFIAYKVTKRHKAVPAKAKAKTRTKAKAKRK